MNDAIRAKKEAKKKRDSSGRQEETFIGKQTRRQRRSSNIEGACDG